MTAQSPRSRRHLGRRLATVLWPSGGRVTSVTGSPRTLSDRDPGHRDPLRPAPVERHNRAAARARCWRAGPGHCHGRARHWHRQAAGKPRGERRGRWRGRRRFKLSLSSSAAWQHRASPSRTKIQGRAEVGRSESRERGLTRAGLGGRDSLSGAGQLEVCSCKAAFYSLRGSESRAS